MRRSICVCEPNYAFAGDSGTWKFTYTTASLLPKGTKLRFDLESGGRNIDWQIPQTNLKEKANLIWAELPNGKTVAAEEVPHPQSATASFEFVLPAELKTGEHFTIWIGSPDRDPKKGTASQKFIQRRRPFYLNIDPKGKGDYKEQELFQLDVRGNQLKTLRVVAPSLVARNKRFDVIVRFEDIYGNLTSNAPEGTLIDLSYEHLRENLNWKLFVPETGFIALPSLYFNEPGIYKIQLRNLKNKETFLSPPIKCLPEGALSLFWGMLHGESDRFDAGENIESWLRHMRDDRSMQFVATSCFDSEEETSNDEWKLVSTQVAEFNEDDRFVALLGFQWVGEPNEEGLRHFIYTKDLKPILRRKDTKNNSLKKIYKTNNPKEMIAIPAFSMGKTTCYNFEDFNYEYERVAEIYNGWGSSECTAKEKNLKPISGSGKNTIPESAEGSLIKALNNGCRFGFVAGGFDDRGPYENLYESNQTQYTPGLTAILAKEHSRASLMEALQARSCYATTGERIILGLHIAGFGMGSELETKSRPGLEFNRHITGYAIGTQPLIEAVLIRNGKIFRTLETNGEKLEFEIDDMDLLGSIALEPREERSPFVYYYLRVTQADGHIGWSSPLWVDQTTKASSNGLKKAKKKSKDVEWS
ncbi:MAG TPA: DUF3604 domain-containing protein [Chlamydiales bacterium]|jgi:hypothetical protein|nr:DUF3604 domain-containing protein [Chlamydiales bacterium]